MWFWCLTVLFTFPNVLFTFYEYQKIRFDLWEGPCPYHIALINVSFPSSRASAVWTRNDFPFWTRRWCVDGRNNIKKLLFRWVSVSQEKMPLIILWIHKGVGSNFKTMYYLTFYANNLIENIKYLLDWR